MTSEQLNQALYLSKIVFKVRLRQLMDRDHLLQKELASVIDVSPILISKYVSGTVFPRYKKLYMIATYFNVPLEVLVGQDKLTALYLKELQQSNTVPKFDNLKASLLNQFVDTYKIDPILAVNECRENIY